MAQKGFDHRKHEAAAMSDDSQLVTVEPPYDNAFIMVRRSLAPSAIFTYERKWIMTRKQLAAVLARMRAFTTNVESEMSKLGEDRDSQRNLRQLKKSLGSMLAVVHWLERPEVWEPPSEEADARLLAEACCEDNEDDC